MDLGGPVFPGDILTVEQLLGRDPNVLVRLNLAEYFQGDAPEPPPTPKISETLPPEVETEEEVAPVEEEPKTADVPVKAEVSKHGVWFKVFAGSMQIGKPTRDEKIAKQLAKEFNAKL